LSSNPQLDEARLIGKLSGGSVHKDESFGAGFDRSSIHEVSSEQLRDLSGTVNSPYYTSDPIGFHIDIVGKCDFKTSHTGQISFEAIFCSSIEEAPRTRRIHLPLIRSKNPGKVRLSNAEIEELLG